MERPTFCTDEHLEYLDALRESGVTNMWGAAEYVEEEFGLPRAVAREIHIYWIKTFGNPDR